MRCEREIVGENLKKKKEKKEKRKQMRNNKKKNVGRKFWER